MEWITHDDAVAIHCVRMRPLRAVLDSNIGANTRSNGADPLLQLIVDPDSVTNSQKIRRRDSHGFFLKVVH